ncbi:hypothetical protein [Pseudoroseicyclus aestuarii]|uniref:Uncharacterized protein n=1 Tax=Pseudoroseicyclus aestuarii TaxID=1795041 RepID=A0A318SS38_9RHOB|nr:hypothetical protein [Pseudoroseicyclus aestuarii]PYE80393.1 hypothetical protein DFP88_1163 [Pseudoroseicyclus aestuarii]
MNAQLRPVDVSALEAYPIRGEDSVARHHFLKFWHNRWLGSTLRLTASLDVRACALDLFFLAQNQTPIGTLPDDDRILARLLHLDLAQWMELRARTPGPLNHWRRCVAAPDDGAHEIRLMHPVVTEVALDMLERREDATRSKEERAVAKRLQRLGEAMLAIGCTPPMAKDRMLLERLDGWLLEHHPGQRRMPRFETSLKRALTHAERHGWLKH